MALKTEKLSSALERVREAVAACSAADRSTRDLEAQDKGHRALPYCKLEQAWSLQRAAREKLGRLAGDLDLILSGCPAMTREQAQAEAEEITKVWYVAICECRHCVKGRTLLERVASALQSAADAAALQARLEMAGRVAALKAEVEKLKAQICALRGELAGG